MPNHHNHGGVEIVATDRRLWEPGRWCVRAGDVVALGGRDGGVRVYLRDMPRPLRLAPGVTMDQARGIFGLE